MCKSNNYVNIHEHCHAHAHKHTVVVVVAVLVVTYISFITTPEVSTSHVAVKDN